MLGNPVFDLIPYNPAWSSKKWFYNLGFEPSGDWTCYLPHSRNANHLTMFNIYWDIFFRIWIKVKYIYEIAFIFTSTLVLLVITFWICKKIYWPETSVHILTFQYKKFFFSYPKKKTLTSIESMLPSNIIILTGIKLDTYFALLTSLSACPVIILTVIKLDTYFALLTSLSACPVIFLEYSS